MSRKRDIKKLDNRRKRIGRQIQRLLKESRNTWRTSDQVRMDRLTSLHRVLWDKTVEVAK